jgi:MFS family permease
MGMGEPASTPSFFLHPANPNFRWVFLFFLCFLTFGSYWCYDIPSALENLLIPMLHITPSQFGLFYGVYNFMNIGIVLVGGLFIDRIGLRVGAVLFCFFIALGQIIVSIGISLPDVKTAYVVMLIGRIVFSIGGESLSVAQSTFCSKWYKGKDLALSFGITLSFARIGSFANMVVTPKMADNISVRFAVWFGTMTCAISLAMTALAAISDKVRDKHVKSEAISAATPFRLRDVLFFPLSLWLIYLICVFYYIGVFTLISITGQPYFKAAFGFRDSDIGTILGLPYMMSVLLAPICGFLVGKVGRKPLFLTIASLLLGAAYACLLWADPNQIVWVGHPGWISPFNFTMYTPPLVGMVLMGLSYSLCAASLWPCVPMLVDENKVGTAYGIMNSIQNGGLALAAVFVGFLGCGEATVECTKPRLFLLLGSGLLAAFLSLFLTIWDASHGRKLTSANVGVEETGPTEKSPLLNEK